MLKRSDLTWRYPKQLKAMMDSTYLFDSNCSTATVRNKSYYQMDKDNGSFYFDFSGDNLLENVTWRQGSYNADGTVNAQSNNSIYAEKISVTPGQTYEIRNNSYYGINDIYKLNIYGYDSNGNKVSLGAGQKTKFLWYYVDTKKTQSSLGESVDFDSDMTTDAKITIPSNVTSIAISATASRSTTNSSQLLGLINSGIFVPQVRQYTSETMSVKEGNGTVNEFPITDGSDIKPIEPNTTVTNAPSVSSSGGSETTNKYLYIKSLKNDGAQNFRFTFGQSGIPSNAKKFVVSTKGSNSTGLEMAFRATVDASYTDDTSSRIALNGSTDWVTNEVDLTASDYSRYHSLLVYVPANEDINIDNVGFILEDGSFKAIQNYESLIVGTKYSGYLNTNNDTESLAKIGFSGTTGWDFNGEFEIKSETTDTTQPSSSNTTATTATSSSSAGGSETTNKYLYIKSLKGDMQNFRFTFGQSGIPSNAKKFVVSTKGSNSTGLEMAFRATVDASYTDDTSSRIALNGSTDWVTNEVDLTAGDYSRYHSLLVYVPANEDINIDNVGFVLEDGSFKAIQNYESLIVGTKYSGYLNTNNDAESLAKIGFSGTTGWDFNGEFEIKSETVDTTQPSSPSESVHKVTIDGSEIEYSGNTVTLPISTKKGFIAYTDGTDYYDENSQVPVLSDINFTTVSIGSVTMLNGASIRLGEVNGMRFHTVVEPDVLATLPQNAIVEKGTLITPKDLLGSEDLTLDASCQKVNIPYTASIYYENNNTFVGSIIKIKETNITRDFIGRGYVKVTLDDYSKTVYADYADNDIANNTRSIAYIANVYSKTEEYASLREDLKEIVDVWANQYETKSEDKLLIEWKNANNFYTPLSSYSTDNTGFNINIDSSSGTDLISSWANNTIGYDGIKFKLNIKADNELNVMGVYVTGNYYKWMDIPSTSGEIEVVIPFSDLDTWTGEAFTPDESQDIKFAKSNDFNGKIDITIGNVYLYKNN